VAEQNLDFNIIAHTQGMEQIANLINRVGALEAETKKLTAANTGLAKSTESVVVSGKRYNNAIDAQSKALRNARQGTQQLGMQINDFATSVSTGASPIQAFNQQIGQVGFALSQMGGKLGVVGRFLAGPWGAAILIGTMLLGQFKKKTEENEEATANFGDYAIATFQSIGASISSGLTPAIEAIQPALIALQPVIDSIGIFFTNLGEVGKMVANGLVRVFVVAINSIAILVGNSFGMVAELVVGTINVGVSAANSLIAMVENALNKMGGYANQASDIFSLGFRVGEANFGRLEMVTNKWAGTSKKTFADVGAAFRKTLSTDFIVGEDISNRADALAAARNAAEKAKEKKGGSDKSGSASARAKKEKPAFSMLGFYEEYFAKEFEKNEQSTAKMAEDQIKSLVSTLPDIAKVSDEMEGILKRNEELNQSFENIGNAVANSFKGMLTGAMSFKDAMKGIISSVIDELFRLFVVQQIVGMVAGAFGSATGTPSRGFGSSTGNYLPGIPANAYGGSVTGNKPTLVGERGPEIFIPGGNGTIIPNSNMRGGGGGGSPISISVDARGSNDPAAVRAQVQQGILEAAPAIIAAAEARTISSMRRPRLGGAMQ
jgi:hypothetical protein